MDRRVGLGVVLADCTASRDRTPVTWYVNADPAATISATSAAGNKQLDQRECPPFRT